MGVALHPASRYLHLPGITTAESRTPLVAWMFMRGWLRLFALSLLLLLSFAAGGGPVHAEPATHDPATDEIRPDGIHILDGSYVLDVGELQVNITNHGLIGSQYSTDVPYNRAPSAQWPGGSGDEYLWGAGLWIGGRLAGEVSVSTGQYERELRPGLRLADTIYEAQGGYLLRPAAGAERSGRRLPQVQADDDLDGTHDEDWLNGRDDDGDGLVDEDFAQIGDQLFTCTMFDNTPLASEVYPNHRPLGLRVVQRAFTWYQAGLEDVVGLDFEITNVGHQTLDEVYLGFFVDCDIQARSEGSTLPDDMAGFFSGAVRDEDGLFYRADIAYMRDGAEQNPLPGCFGVMLIDHTTEFIGRDAPFHPAVNSFQIFATNASVQQEGEPNNDADRYYLMSRNQHDRDTRPDEATDMKYLVSSGPFNHVDPGKTLNYRLALVIGDGLQGMLQTAVEAGKVGAGRWYNRDGSWWTGRAGRETKVCLGDYRNWETGEDPIYGHRVNFMNHDCAGDFPIMFQDVVRDSLLEPDSEGNLCIWVNMDNCEECFRVRGHDCTPEVFHSTYMGNVLTGVWGREAHYPWSIHQETPPPAPGFRVQPGNHRVEIFWDDVSEHTVDPDRGVNDFESYRVWRVSHWTRPPGTAADAIPPAHMWGMIEEYDLINFIPAEAGNSNTDQTLGRNTGLEDAVYVPPCLSDDRFAGLAEEMQAVVDGDPQGVWLSRPPLRHFDGSVIPGMEGLVRWESYPDVLDTFWTVTPRQEAEGVTAKRAGRYYHFLDVDAPNGFQVYYAVTAADHLLVYDDGVYLPAGYGIQEDPGNNFQTTTPRPDAQTPEERRREGNNIYVYPNPATREALQEFLAQHPGPDDPTGVRVMWNNLPRAHNTIHIFTESGDLVKTLHHDGFSQGGSTAWNLVSRNGQEVVSGIYLYVVKSDSGAFDDYQGWFVVVK
jgi:hypothetical protein